MKNFSNYLLICVIITMIPFTVTAQDDIGYVLATSNTAAGEQQYYDFVPYVNSTFGIYLEHPSDWEIVTPNNVIGDRVLKVVQIWSPDGTGVVSVSRDIFDVEESLNTYLAETIQHYRTVFSNFTLLNSDTLQTTLADNEGYGIYYSYNEDDTGLSYLTSEVGTIIPGTDLAYFTEYNAPLRYFATNEEIASQILDTLEFHIQLPNREAREQPELEIDQSTGDAGEI
jgi:hypothetical protein